MSWKLMRIGAGIAFTILAGALFYLGQPVNADTPSERRSVDAAACTRLTSLSLPNTPVASASVVAAGTFKPPAGAEQGFADLPALCRVALTIKPSPDSDIKSEIWLPLSGWNGKFQEVGHGGWAGSIPFGELAAPGRRGSRRA